MKRWLRARPWIWLVLLFLTMIVANVVMLFVALANPTAPI